MLLSEPALIVCQNVSDTQDNPASEGGQDPKHSQVGEIVKEASAPHVEASVVKDQRQANVKKNDVAELELGLFVVDSPYRCTYRYADQDYDACLVPELAVARLHPRAHNDIDKHQEAKQEHLSVESIVRLL